MQEATIVLPIVWKWLLGVCGMITAVGAAAAIIYKVLVKPWKELVGRVETLEKKHASDQQENNNRFASDLDAIRKYGNDIRQLCRGMFVLLDHAATGNSIEKCKKTRDEMTSYLTDNLNDGHQGF